MKKNIWFIVDTSGSMYQEGIAMVNNTLLECRSELIRAISDDMQIKVGVCEFNEEFRICQELVNVEKTAFPILQVQRGSDDYFRLTSLRALYEGLGMLCSKKEKDSEQVFILMTDGKSIEQPGQEAARKETIRMPDYRMAQRRVAVKDYDGQHLSVELLMFADDHRDRIVSFEHLSEELTSFL